MRELTYEEKNAIRIIIILIVLIGLGLYVAFSFGVLEIPKIPEVKPPDPHMSPLRVL